MKISIIGDSISTFEGYIPEGYETKYPFGNVKQVEQTWWYQMIERNGWTLGHNNSFSGSRISNTSPLQIPHTNFSDDSRILNFESDIIIIFGGTNDYGAVMNQPDMKEFKEQYRYMLSNLIKKNPNSKFILCTPLRRLDIKTKTKPHKKLKLKKIARAIKDVSSEYKCCKVIDLYSHKIKLSDFFFIDGVHPNEKGMSSLSNWIETGIKEW